MNGLGINSTGGAGSTYYSKNKNRTGSRGTYPGAGNNAATSDINDKIQSRYQSKTEEAGKTKNPGASIVVSTYTDKEGRVHTTYTGKGTDIVESMKEAKVDTNKDKEKVKKRLDYSYQRVSSQVVMAKSSLSAARAVLSARRSLQELKQKLKTAECSDDEKQAALAHATSMLRLATKKKKNLEMEEMIRATMKMDERLQKAAQSEGSISVEKLVSESKSEETESDGDGSEAYTDEELMDDMASESESGLLDMAMDDMEDITSEISGSVSGGISDEMTEEMTEEFSEDMAELMTEMSEEMEEMMDMLEEVVNPHMSEEQFEKFKTKNRCEEQKAQVKADMEYLKVLIQAADSSPSMAGMSGGAGASGMPAVSMDAGVAQMSLGFSVMV